MSSPSYEASLEVDITRTITDDVRAILAGTDPMLVAKEYQTGRDIGELGANDCDDDLITRLTNHRESGAEKLAFLIGFMSRRAEKEPQNV